jgi:hypothetical protein
VGPRAHAVSTRSRQSPRAGSIQVQRCRRVVWLSGPPGTGPVRSQGIMRQELTAVYRKDDRQGPAGQPQLPDESGLVKSALPRDVSMHAAQQRQLAQLRRILD